MDDRIPFSFPKKRIQFIDQKEKRPRSKVVTPRPSLSRPVELVATSSKMEVVSPIIPMPCTRNSLDQFMQRAPPPPSVASTYSNPKKTKTKTIKVFSSYQYEQIL